MEEGGERPAGLGAEEERTSRSGAKTVPANSMRGAKWNRSGHCRKSNKAQNVASGAPLTADGLSNWPPAADCESSCKTGDSNAISSALENTGSSIPAHIT